MRFQFKFWFLISGPDWGGIHKPREQLRDAGEDKPNDHFTTQAILVKVGGVAKNLKYTVGELKDLTLHRACVVKPL